MTDPATERERQIIGDVLTAAGNAIAEGSTTSTMLRVMLTAMGAVMSREPDPADVAERVKVLEAEARAQQVVLDAFNASVKILKHNNEKLREVLAGMQWVYPFNTASPRCRGCGTAKGNEHAHNCEIYNALNPKTEWEAAKVVCEECEPKISCENCARFKPLCCNINFREDCGDFMPRSKTAACSCCGLVNEHRSDCPSRNGGANVA